MPAIVRAECFVCRAPIEHPVINAFAVFVRLTDADGLSGWGEIGSLSDFMLLKLKRGG